MVYGIKVDLPERTPVCTTCYATFRRRARRPRPDKVKEDKATAKARSGIEASLLDLGVSPADARSIIAYIATQYSPRLERFLADADKTGDRASGQQSPEPRRPSSEKLGADADKDKHISVGGEANGKPGVNEDAGTADAEDCKLVSGSGEQIERMQAALELDIADADRRDDVSASGNQTKHRRHTIPWTDKRPNPFVAIVDGKEQEDGRMSHFCSHRSPGCQNCYSEILNMRFGNKLEYIAQNEKRVTMRLSTEKLDEVLGWEKPKKVFWADMTDIFHRLITDQMIDECLAVMALTPRHIHQVLTKRHERMQAYLSDPARPAAVGAAMRRILERRKHAGAVPAVQWPLPSVWVGVSAEDQRNLNVRVPALLWAPAAVRFVSYEPALELVSLSGCEGVDWVIFGGESGPKARPCDPEWARQCISQCRKLEIACFVKQLGSNPAGMKLADYKGEEPGDWPPDLRVREFPKS
jgi:protein gp37